MRWIILPHYGKKQKVRHHYKLVASTFPTSDKSPRLFLFKKSLAKFNSTKDLAILLEPRTGLEPVTSSLPWMRSTN